MHTIKMKKYATGNPKDAFRALMEEVEHKVHHFRKDCWNITLELLADHLGLMDNPWRYSVPNVEWKGNVSEPSYHGLGELKKQIPVDLIEAYIAAAKANPWDYPGEIFTEDMLAGKANHLAQVLTPRQIIDFMLKCTIGENLKKTYSYTKPDHATLIWQTAEALAFNDKLPINLLAERARRHTVLDLTPLLIKYEPKPITDLDPCVGTGRFLIAATLMYPKLPLLLYGVEIDRSLYRACLVNMAMFSNHPYFIICADTLMLDSKYAADVSSPMWGLGNQWDPPDMTPYYFKIAPPFKFSLADLAKNKKPAEETSVVITEVEKPFSLAQLVKKKPELKPEIEQLA
jgi:hypothetical protein